MIFRYEGGGRCVAKQAEDIKTLELPGLEIIRSTDAYTPVQAVGRAGGPSAVDGSSTPIKRGRGRPRIENPLTNAERQQRWREKQKRLKRIGRPEVVYRGPDGETWTGRGQVPKWLQVLVREGGVDKSMYLVNKP